MKIKMLIASVLLSFPMCANAISQEDLLMIDKKVNEFKPILLSSDIVTLVDNLPPKIYKETAKFYGYSEIGLRQSMLATQQWYKNTRQPKTFDCNINQRLEGKTKFRNYVIFPCTATGLMNNHFFITTGSLVAFTDNYQWQIYWIKNKDDWQIAKNAYPDLANIGLPK